MNPPIRLPHLPTPNSVLQRLASTQPASSILPVSLATSLPQFVDVLKGLDTLWESNKSLYNDAYKIGKSYHGIDADAAYTEFLLAFLTLFFNVIKEQLVKSTPNLEEQQAKLLLLSSIQKALNANIAILKNLDFPIDKTQLVAILNGYSMTQTAGILKK